MKRMITAAIVAMGCTVAVAAQSGTADQAKDKGTMAKDATMATATGCIAESGGKYMLSNATMASSTTPMTYMLSGGSLKAHVGHKVEVTGTMKPAKDMMKKDSMSKDSMAKDPTMAKDSMKKDDMSAGTLTVKSVKMVAETCS